MSSGPPQKSRRLRFRFSDGSTGTEKASVSQKEKLSSDDILDSLRKQSDNRLEETGEVEEIVEGEDIEAEEQDNGISLISAAVRDRRNSSHHRLGFVFVVFTGLVVVAVYESFTRPASALSIVRMVENVDVRSIFGSLFQASIVALTGMLALGWIARHRRKHYVR